MFKKLLILAMVCLSGCSLARPPVTPPGTEIVFNLRPIVITSYGKTSWTAEEIESRLAEVNRSFATNGIRFVILNRINLERPDLYMLDDEFSEIATLSKQRAQDHYELAVYFVNKITLAKIEYGGLANYPSNLQGSIHQHGIAVSRYSYRSAVAHEIGHAFNLPHSWVKNASIRDTTSSDSSDCDSPDKYCNIMSYCGGCSLEDECLPHLLTENQKQEMLNWAAFPPRSEIAVSIGHKDRHQKSIPVYTSNTQPATCH